MERHAFISYVHEDKDAVDRIQRILEAAGVPVWRDTEDLWPGEDWKQKIREAITRNALAFIACFSETSISKAKTYQNEELALAVDQFRLRNPQQAWLIPVRLSDCDLPAYDLGAGRTLDSLQRIDLFENNWDEAAARLVAGVVRITGGSQGSETATAPLISPAEAGRFVRTHLLQPTRRIELEERVATVAERCFERLSNVAEFPYDSDRVAKGLHGYQFLGDQVKKYVQSVRELAEVLIVGAAWGIDDQAPIWRRAMERVGASARGGSGKVALIDLRRLPLAVLLYSTAVAAQHRLNYYALRAVAIDAQFRSNEGKVPLLGAVNAWVPFGRHEMTAQLLVLQVEGVEINEDLLQALTSGRRGKRYTPESDLFHYWCREWLRSLIPDEDDYTETFDRTEVLLGALGMDLKLQTPPSAPYVVGPAFGAFTWRDRYWSPNLERQMLADAERMGAEWPPVQSGLFGGSMERARAALEAFVLQAEEYRHRRY